MGAEDAEGFLEDGEGPVREVELSPFAIEAHAVTNRRFAEFVDATGYMTDAERYGWSFVFAGLLPDSFPERAASSTHRGGGRSSVRLALSRGPAIRDRGQTRSPVVHVSWRDARPLRLGAAAASDRGRVGVASVGGKRFRGAMSESPGRAPDEHLAGQVSDP